MSHAEHRLTGEIAARIDSRCNIQAVLDVYATSEGKCVALSTGTQGMAERLPRDRPRRSGRRFALSHQCRPARRS
jgi:hypothetical protein